MLFRHGAANEVRLPQRVARELLENLHNLFLIDDDAVGIFENGLQERRVVNDLIGMILVADIGGNEIHGTRAIEGNTRDQIFKTVRLQILHKPFHAALFELKHRVRISGRDQLIRFGHVVADFIEVDIDSQSLFDIAEGILNIRKSREGEEVHFQHSYGFHFLHVELRHDVVAVFGEGHVVGEHLAADDDAGGVFGGILGHSFQL